VIPLKDDNPAERFPLVTIALVAASIVAFWWQVAGVGLEASVVRGGAIPYEILTLQDIEWRDVVPPPFTILTSMFLHGGVAHVGFNMLTLWIFGNNVEDALGRVRFLAFYLLSGIAAALSQTLASAISGDVLTPMVGASGAIAGVLGAYFFLFPRARVVTLLPLFVFFTVVEIPAVVFLGLWFLIQILSGTVSLGRAGAAGGVAWWAHVGGFVAGIVLLKVFASSGRGRGGATV